MMWYAGAMPTSEKNPVPFHLLSPKSNLSLPSLVQLPSRRTAAASPVPVQDKLAMRGRTALLAERKCNRVDKGAAVRQLGNFRYILIPEINNMFMTNISDPVRAKHVHVFKLNFK
jgi:hypothetical protein